VRAVFALSQGVRPGDGGAGGMLQEHLDRGRGGVDTLRIMMRVEVRGESVEETRD